MGLHTKFSLGFTRVSVFFCRKANKTLILQIDFERWNGCDDNLDP